MARRLTFTLELLNDANSMDDLQNNFFIDVVKYYINTGDLDIWLRDRNYNEIADSIQKIDFTDSKADETLCSLFSVNYDECKNKQENSHIIYQVEKVEKLKKYTDNEKYFDVIELIAFTQKDLVSLLENNEISIIYLCGDEFEISSEVKNMTYIGINKPMVKNAEKKEIDWLEIGVKFENVEFDDAFISLDTSQQKKRSSHYIRTYMKQTVYDSFCGSHFGSLKQVYFTLQKCLDDGYFENDTTGKLVLNNSDIDLAKSVLNDLENVGIFVERGEDVYISPHVKTDKLPDVYFENCEAEVIPRLLAGVYENKEYLYWGGGKMEKTCASPYTEQYEEYVNGINVIDYVDMYGDEDKIDGHLRGNMKSAKMKRLLLEYNGGKYYYEDSKFLYEKDNKSKNLNTWYNMWIGRIIAINNRIYFIRGDLKFMMYECYSNSMIILADSVEDFFYYDDHFYYIKKMDYKTIYGSLFHLIKCDLDGKQEELIKDLGWMNPNITNCRIKEGKLCYVEGQRFLGHTKIPKEIELGRK